MLLGLLYFPDFIFAFNILVFHMVIHLMLLIFPSPKSSVKCIMQFLVLIKSSNEKLTHFFLRDNKKCLNLLLLMYKLFAKLVCCHSFSGRFSCPFSQYKVLPVCFSLPPTNFNHVLTVFMLCKFFKTLFCHYVIWNMMSQRILRYTRNPHLFS